MKRAVTVWLVGVCVAVGTAWAGCSDDETGGAGGSAGATAAGGSGGQGGTGTGTGGTAGGGGGGEAWVCEAAPDGHELYVALDGDDTNPGTMDAPFASFGPAVTRAEPGDVIYVRAGTYGREQAMVRGVARDYDSYPATSCPPGEVLADEYCFHDTYAFIALGDFSGWASNSEPYQVQSGTEDRPISICACPGEQVTLDATGFTQRAVAVSLKAFWTIADFEIVGGMVNIGGGTADAQPHDIVIRRNEVHDITVDGGDNPGIVRIDRGDIEGPWNIFVWDNELHGIYDVDQPDQWQNVPDAQHFGAVTTLSRENYLGFEGGGTGYVEIVGNTMYHLPQVFFFKNPMAGPVEIRGNLIYDSGRIGDMGAANVHMVHNVVHGVSSGWWKVGNGGYEDERLQDIAGQDAVIEYNTFVGLDSLLGMRCGTGHTIRYNVVFGLTGQTAGANWDTPAYLRKSETYPDPLDPADSILHDVTSNHNCFITPHADFQAVSRYIPPSVTGGDWHLDHWDLTDARSIFGFDADSTVIVESDATNVFVDPDADDYRLLDPSQCPGMGYHAYAGSSR